MPKKHVASQSQLLLPKQVQKHVDMLVEWLIGVEELGYQSPLKSFSQRSKEMKQKGQEFFTDAYKSIKHARELVSENLGSDAIYEKAAEKLRKKMNTPNFSFDRSQSMQEQLMLPWAFMDKVYELANNLLRKRHFGDAMSVFQFLRFLQPLVFEYWLGEATCLQELGKWEEAVNKYLTSLFYSPNNPLVFFQIGLCYYELKEIKNCKEALNFFLKHAKNDPQYAPLRKEVAAFIKNLPIH